MPAEKDRFAVEAEKLCLEMWGLEDMGPESSAIAAFGRECDRAARAEAFEEAAGIVGQLAIIRIGISGIVEGLERRAAALRQGSHEEEA